MDRIRYACFFLLDLAVDSFWNDRSQIFKDWCMTPPSLPDWMGSGRAHPYHQPVRLQESVA
jgi:hypothetical protein